MSVRAMRRFGWLVGGVALQTAACGVTVKRDISATKPGVVVFDDMCELQSYFDALHDSTIAPPREVFGQDLSSDDKGRAVGGRTRMRFDTEFQLHHFRKLLTTNWGGLPEEVQKASALELEVRWSEKAGVKRVVTTEAAVLGADAKSFDLPYHVCLSDFLFGEELYRTRRTVLSLPPPAPSQFSKRKKDEPYKSTFTWGATPSAPVAATPPAASTTTSPATAVPAAPAAPAPAPGTVSIRGSVAAETPVPAPTSSPPLAPGQPPSPTNGDVPNPTAAPATTPSPSVPASPTPTSSSAKPPA